MDTLNLNGVEYVAVDEFTEFTENHHNHMVTDEHVKYLDKISHILPEHIKAEQDCKILKSPVILNYFQGLLKHQLLALQELMANQPLPNF